MKPFQRTLSFLFLTLTATLFAGSVSAQQQTETDNKEKLKNDTVAELLVRGRNLTEQAKYSEAKKIFEQVVELNPRTPGVSVALTLVYMGLGEHDKALKSAYREMELSPNSATAYNNSGYALHLLVKNDEAITILKKAIELDPKLSKAYFNLADAYRSSGMLTEDTKIKAEQFTKAEAVLESYLKIQPNDEKALAALVNIAMTAENYEKAVAYSLERVKIKPADFDALKTLGITYLQNGKPADAAAALERACLLNSENYDCRRFLAIALATSDQTEKSLKYLEKIVVNEPTIYFDLGMAAFYAKKFGSAVEYFNRAVMIDSSSAKAIYQLSLSHLASGNPVAAMEQYDKLKKLNSADAEELLRRIENTAENKK